MAQCMAVKSNLIGCIVVVCHDEVLIHVLQVSQQCNQNTFHCPTLPEPKIRFADKLASKPPSFALRLWMGRGVVDFKAGDTFSRRNFSAKNPR